MSESRPAHFQGRQNRREGEKKPLRILEGIITKPSPNKGFRLILYPFPTRFLDLPTAQAMTEAAIFTIGRSRIIGYGKFGLWPITEAEADC